MCVCRVPYLCSVPYRVVPVPVQVADAFAFDVLVEAVAFSNRKYEFGRGADNVRFRLREAAAKQEV